jgi:hypothetical protein
VIPVIDPSRGNIGSGGLAEDVVAIGGAFLYVSDEIEGGYHG